MDGVRVSVVLMVALLLGACGHAPRARDSGRRGLFQGRSTGRSFASSHAYGVPLHSRRPSAYGFIWPVRVGYISSSFGVRARNMHTGLDIAAPRGTPVYAAQSGTVVYAGKQIEGYGNLVIIKHSQSSASVYAHNDVNLVRRGQQVEQGRMIATVGSTGRATGPHLHFEVRHKESAIDPLRYLNGPRSIQARR